jgi:Protein of unknown function, DUF
MPSSAAARNKGHQRVPCCLTAPARCRNGPLIRWLADAPVSAGADRRCSGIRRELWRARCASTDHYRGCCTGWVQHLQGAGFTTKVIDTRDLDPLRRRLGVPDDLAACHTAEVAGYVIEGHVPAGAVPALVAR